MPQNDDRETPETFEGAAPTENRLLKTDIPEDYLFTYVIIRGDLEMAPGKIASQAVHAARLSLLHFLKDCPARADEFIKMNSCGSVVVVVAKNLSQIETAYSQATNDGFPAALFSDSGHIPIVWKETSDGSGKKEMVVNQNFNGDPTVTALAIGPALKSDMRHITKRFRCL